MVEIYGYSFGCFCVGFGYIQYDKDMEVKKIIDE